MDDLDHSIHISESDWSSFYEESEECVLLQAALARPDDSSLSDSEECVHTDSVWSTREEDTQHSTDASTDASTDRADTNCSAEEERCARELQGDANEEEDVTRAQTCLGVMPVQAAEEQAERGAVRATDAPQSEAVPGSGELTEDRDVITGSDLDPTEEPHPLPPHPKGLDANETLAVQGAASREAAGSAPLRPEKERWFVTVNAGPPRRRAAPGKKKRRAKKQSDGSGAPSAGHHGPSDSLVENSQERRPAEEGDESQSQPRSVSRATKTTRSGTTAPDSPPLTETSGEDDDDRAPHTRSITGAAPANSSGTTLTSAFTPPQPERAEWDELDDSAEFLSTHSSDSESFLSAAESVEEHQLPAAEEQPLHCPSGPTADTSLLALPGDADRQEAGTDARGGFIHNSEGDHSRTPELPLTFPPPEMSADGPARSDGAHGAAPCMTPDTAGAPAQQLDPSASGCSQGDQPSVPPVPDLTVTPCTPETFAQAAGHVRPVYAISAFWDEMEKLTINDILQLRTRRSSSPAERPEALTHADDCPRSPAPPAEAVDDGVSDGVSGSAAMDTSDAADSDYFTQADESKPDRSSCDFSTSDFEEEYWQFLGASRSASPDADGRKRESDASFSQCEEEEEEEEEEESAGSEGRRTPVPVEDPAGLRLDLLALSDPAAPRQIRKSKSLRNVPASATAPARLDGDEGDAFLSLRQSVEESVAAQVSDRLLALSPPPSLCSTDTLDTRRHASFPQTFELLLSDDRANAASRCVTVYPPEDVSVASLFHLPFSPLRDGAPRPAVHGGVEQPIPIFSCSHPTVRDLTFPTVHYTFLGSSSRADDFSPIRVVSRSYMGAEQPGCDRCSSLLSIRRLRFHHKGSVWCGRSGVWMFPAEEESVAVREDEPVAAMLGEAGARPASSQLFRELEEQQRILGATHTAERDGVFSSLKQSDMCLVCIAFASWVLKSSDPEAADTWKAALLANVSALSAIQYLRQYVMKRKRPAQDEA